MHICQAFHRKKKKKKKKKAIIDTLHLINRQISLKIKQNLNLEIFFLSTILLVFVLIWTKTVFQHEWVIC